ncbi:hypothetical protein [Micromonospora sp. NBS 11-29]|uniref:hypothetical protein n=1 Tax=Micromonospora sp. NBS 11-29 TaxID=1960879 RepID=UPI001594471B|nr:hypothetical protein [Micromonospora sp. NBS 11-29]
MTDTSPDHIPAHVKGSYVNCSEYTRAPRLTPPPTSAPTDAPTAPQRALRLVVGATR